MAYRRVSMVVSSRGLRFRSERDFSHTSPCLRKLMEVDAELFEPFCGPSFGTRARSADTQGDALAPWVSFSCNVAPESYVGRSLGKPRIGFLSALLIDMPLLVLSPHQRLTSSLTWYCNRGECSRISQRQKPLPRHASGRTLILEANAIFFLVHNSPSAACRK